jgi:hypothetical protein
MTFARERALLAKALPFARVARQAGITMGALRTIARDNEQARWEVDARAAMQRRARLNGRH